MFLGRLWRIAFPVPVFSAITIHLVVFLALTGCSLGGNGDGKARQVTFLPANVLLRAEVADTDRTREKGLMYRTYLGENDGMIFYFDQPGHHAFYMYNTRIPLSVIFLNGSLEIVDLQDMAPCMEENPSACPIYAPKAACSYAIEVNQQFVRKYGIKTGDRVRIEK
jgi:uncharacterized membrane protein (UPF0127 family)